MRDSQIDICFDTDMGDFENSGKPDPASAHVTPKTAIGGALSGRELRDVLLFLDAVYRGIGPLNLAGAPRRQQLSPAPEMCTLLLLGGLDSDADVRRQRLFQSSLKQVCALAWRRRQVDGSDG